jgi:hypothetical protein
VDRVFKRLGECSRRPLLERSRADNGHTVGVTRASLHEIYERRIGKLERTRL